MAAAGPPKKRRLRRIVRFAYYVALDCVAAVYAPVKGGARVFRNLGYRLRYVADDKAWIRFHNAAACWDGRREKVARLIPPRSRALELGVGEGRLEKLLDPSVTHAAADPLKSAPGGPVWKLDASPSSLAGHAVNAAAICGVLEYAPQIEIVATWLALHVSWCAVSYPCVKSSNVVLAFFAAVLRRIYHGYRSAYAEEEVVAIFETSGFHCVARDPWRTERIFLFSNERPES